MEYSDVSVNNGKRPAIEHVKTQPQMFQSACKLPAQSTSAKATEAQPAPELLDPYSFFQELHLEEVAIIDPAVLVGVHAADLVLHLVPYGNSHLLQPVYHFLS